jgi:CheY-like chemotaxis protein
MRLLVVDDSATERTLVARFLANAGCRVETAVDGVDALERFTTDPFDVVVCDCDMPRMGGLELCRAIRGLPAGADTYLIMLSGRDAAIARAQSITAGVDAFLTKPCSPPDLIKIVRAAELMLAAPLIHAERRAS